MGRCRCRGRRPAGRTRARPAAAQQPGVASPVPRAHAVGAAAASGARRQAPLHPATSSAPRRPVSPALFGRRGQRACLSALERQHGSRTREVRRGARGWTPRAVRPQQRTARADGDLHGYWCPTGAAVRAARPTPPPPAGPPRCRAPTRRPATRRARHDVRREEREPRRNTGKQQPQQRRGGRRAARGWVGTSAEAARHGPTAGGWSGTRRLIQACIATAPPRRR
jgi:hypothetical protein